MIYFEQLINLRELRISETPDIKKKIVHLSNCFQLKILEISPVYLVDEFITLSGLFHLTCLILHFRCKSDAVQLQREEYLKFVDDQGYFIEPLYIPNSLERVKTGRELFFEMLQTKQMVQTIIQKAAQMKEECLNKKRKLN